MRYSLIILCISFCLLGWLAVHTYYINAWPSDSAASYIPTAERLFDMPFFSHMHDLHLHGLSKLNMRGKEALVVGIAFLQRLLRDTKSLYPNVLLLIISSGLSAWLFFQIFKRFFNDAVGFMAFILFAFSFWPYMYVIFGAHQPLVLCHFLLSFFFLQCSVKRRFCLFFAGLFFGLVFFSSPTAIIYTPYYFLLLLCGNIVPPVSAWSLKEFLRSGGLFMAGLFCVLLAFTLPHPVHSMKMFIIYVFLSRGNNHFQYYSDYLVRFFPVPPFLRGGGWIWIFKYFMLIMPVMFAGYVLSLIFLLVRPGHTRKTFLLILLSLSTPLLVEIIQVAQFGRNYFSWFFGMVFLICAAVYRYVQIHEPFDWRKHKVFCCFLLTLLAAHIGFNAHVFLGDVLPSRMATTYAYQWLKDHDIKELLVYQDHHSNTFTADVLNNPKSAGRIKMWGIQSFLQAKGGYLLLPGTSGTTIWNDCSKDRFSGDKPLQDIIRAGLLDACAVASFKTVASSPYWNQEEEVCTYRDLMLQQISGQDRRMSRIYILDVSRLRDVYFSLSAKQTAQGVRDEN